MIWTNKGLKKRIAELEAEVSSLNVELKDTKFNHLAMIDLHNYQNDIVENLRVDLAQARKTSSSIVVPLEVSEKPSLTLGQAIARKLRGNKV